MKRRERIQRLKKLEQEVQQFRERLRFSERGEVLFQASQGMWTDNEVIVEADGTGGASLQMVAGNYPIVYSVKFEKRYRTEDAACKAAETLLR